MLTRLHRCLLKPLLGKHAAKGQTPQAEIESLCGRATRPSLHRCALSEITDRARPLDGKREISAAELTLILEGIVKGREVLRS